MTIIQKGKPMSDLISRQAAIEAMSESLKRVFPEHRQIAEKCLNALPSAQPERKKGHWVADEDGNIKCSECGHSGVCDNYCERCGADMRGKE